MIFFAALLFVGCTTDKLTLQIVEEAENVMIDHPDSALKLMRSIDVETIRGEEDMAHYTLVMAEACYYNRITPNRDTIAQPLFDYYLRSDDHDKRSRALYQYALVMMSEGENARAMYSLQEAEESLVHVDNPRLAGLVHRVKGDIYNSESLYRLSLEEFNREKEMFDKAGLDRHYNYALLSIAVIQNSLRNYDESIQTLLELECLAINSEDYLLQFASQIYLCHNYIALGDFASCSSVLSRTDPSNSDGYYLCDYYFTYAVLEAYRGNFQSADDFLSLAKEAPVNNPMRLNHAEYLVHIYKGNIAEAHEMYLSMIAVQDENVFNIINNSLLQSQVDLLSNEIDNAEKMRVKNRTLYLLSAIIFVILLVILIFIIVYRHRKYRQNIKHYIETIADFELVKKSQGCELDSGIERLYRQSLNEINELCEIYYEQGGSSHLASKVASQVAKNIEKLKNDERRIEELESAVNVSRNGIMQKLREQCPELNERDMRIALYTYAGFSNRAISLLVGCTSESLPKFKYSIREQIKSSQAPDMIMLTEPLYNKKR